MSGFALPFSFYEVSNNTAASKDTIIYSLSKCGIFLCRKGTLTLKIQNEQYILKAHDLLIYLPSVYIELNYVSDDINGIIISSDLNNVVAISKLMFNVSSILAIRQSPIIALSQKQYDTFAGDITHYISGVKELVHDAPDSNRFIKTQLIESMSHALLYKLLYIYLTSHPMTINPQTQKDVIFQKFMTDLYKYYRKERTVAFYARMQHLTPRYFSSIIKERSGSNVLQWIDLLVVGDLKIVLRDNSLSIKEIATMFNFSNQSFFTKYFKRNTGCTPKEYRSNPAR